MKKDEVEEEYTVTVFTDRPGCYFAWFEGPGLTRTLSSPPPPIQKFFACSGKTFDKALEEARQEAKRRRIDVVGFKKGDEDV